MLRTITDFPNYSVSDDGMVINKRTGRVLKTREKDGYLSVFIYNENGRSCFTVHRLVAREFIPNPDNLPQINHRDEDRKNNSVDNLEWCSAKYNCNYGLHNKKHSESTKGERNHFYGKKHTDVSKRKMSAAKLGKPSKRKKPVQVNGYWYPSVIECLRALEISSATFYRSKNEKNGKYQIRYFEED